MDTLALPGFADRRPSMARYAVATLLIAAILGALLPERAEAATVTRTWFGWTVDFTKAETNGIAAGLGACWAISAAIPDPAVSKAVSVSCGLAAVYAGWVLGAGRCLRAWGPWVMMPGVIPPVMLSSYGGPTCK